MGKTILIVDDDPAQRRLLQASVERNGFATRTAENGSAAVQAVETHQDIDVVLLDLVMPGMSGQEALKEIRARRPELPCIVLTASGGIDTVVQAMQAGASDFFVKPASPERMLVSIRNALDMSNLKTEVVRLKKKASGQLSFDDMVAAAPVMGPVVRMGRRAAASNIPVLITGESGVGKELLARAIQGASERAGRPFVTVNCGAIPENLVESILFGHAKGSFTGAVDNHAGKFAEANTGTLFLDEVGELPLDAQVKLLRVLQEGEVRPLGGRENVKVDVRLICATNRNLEAMVRDGEFREDLYYRLAVLPVHLPPLRDRKEDIPQLVKRFLVDLQRETQARVRVSPDAMERIVQYAWPGNVRELQNEIRRAAILCDGIILETHLSQHVREGRSGPGANLADDGLVPSERGTTLPDMVRELETREIQKAFERAQANKSRAADLLGLSRFALQRKLEKYALDANGRPTGAAPANDETG
jgi:DNA-binding NtrC family response regulator